ncbi:MAG: hypothetical protein ABSF64_29580 [Bryobacteraceae bacterium]
MTKNRMFLFAALALILAFGASSQLALAADGPKIHAVILGHAPGVSHGAAPDATPTASSGITAMGPINAAWPAFCGATGTGCASDPSGTILIGAPEELFSAATCTSSTVACGQIYNFVESNTATGNWEAQIEVKQGASVIYDSGLVNFNETFPAGDIGYTSASVGFGPGDCPAGVTCVAPKAGAATITYTNKIGKVTITGTQTITLQ